MAFDLTGIEPTRRKQILHRIRILEKYIKIPRPSVQTANKFAEEMEVKLSTFYALAKVWRSTRNPQELSGAGIRKTKTQNKASSLPKASIAIVEEVIGALGPWLTDRRIIESAQAKLKDQGLRRVSKQTIKIILDRTRATTQTLPPSQPAILIENCYLSLPQTSTDGIELPVACIALQVPENIIIAYDLGTVSNPPNTQIVLAQIERLPASCPRRGRPLVRRDLMAKESTENNLNKSNPLLRLRTLLGGKIGPIAFTVQHSRPKSWSLSRLESPLTSQEVYDLFENAVEQHNSNRAG